MGNFDPCQPMTRLFALNQGALVAGQTNCTGQCRQEDNMAIRSILVHVNDDTNNDTTIRAAISIARQNEAVLTGLYVRPFPIVVPVAPIGGAMPVIDGMIEAYQQACEAVRKRFETATTGAGISHDWRDDDGDPAEQIGFHGRYTDIVVLGQVPPDQSDGRTPRDFPAIATMNSGRPTLAIPYAGEHGTTIKRAMLCWNATREASRALHDSLMILQPGARIDVLCVDAEDGQDRLPGAEIAAHLTRHGFEAVAHHLASGDLSASETILSASAEMDSELIIMGAYGHARIREIALGGVTRSLMEHMPVPVLMAH
jgi:nucleotide-binding universal stress UspA family protein